MPFLSEAMYRNLVVPFDPTAPDSVHLTRWLSADETLIDQKLLAEMRLVKRLVSLGHAARNSAELRVRQPLAEAAFAVRTADEAAALRKFEATVAEELNVKAIRLLDEQSASGMIRYSLNPLPHKLGKRLGSLFPTVQKLLRESDEAQVTAWARQLLAGEPLSVSVNGDQIALSADEVEVLRTAAEGFTVAEENGYVAALQTTLTEPLIMEGLAREVVRRVNLMRRDADYALSDTIQVTYAATPRLARALEVHSAYVRDETLAARLEAVSQPEGDKVEQFAFDGETITLGIKRLSTN
jgi:isoleucyl-tRNA synthetase